MAAWEYRWGGYAVPTDAIRMLMRTLYRDSRFDFGETVDQLLRVGPQMKFRTEAMA
jgi:hypothetical protein